MRLCIFVLLCSIAQPLSTAAEVTGVTIASRTTIADGRAREANGDQRLSIEERYRGVDDYVQRVRSAAMELIRDRLLLAEDLDGIVERAKAHWTFATREARR